MSHFEAGQVWMYRTRPGEENSRITILWIQPHEKLGTIVHIRVDGISQRSLHLPGVVHHEIHHMTFCTEGISNSVTRLVGSGAQIPDLSKIGLDLWKTYHSKNATMFTETVAEVLNRGEGSWTQPLAQPRAKPFRRMIDHSKCKALKRRLGPDLYGQILPIAEFFDGNDDPGSIGCNLHPHPGISVFRDVLTGLLRRPDVEAVYAQISELDPGEKSWPFSDKVLVAGEISAADLRSAVKSLQPDEVGDANDFGVSPTITEKHGMPVLVVWWD
jgi:hypothetical protein